MAEELPTWAKFELQITAVDKDKFYTGAEEAVVEKFYMDEYFDILECPNKDITTSKELVHLHLLGFKFTKFESKLPYLVDRIDNSPQSDEPKVNIWCQKDSWHVFGLMWDVAIDTLIVSCGTSFSKGLIVDLKLHMFGYSSQDNFGISAFLRSRTTFFTVEKET